MVVFLVALVWSGPAPAQTGSFTITDKGHEVGTAHFEFVVQADGVESSSVVKVQMQGLDYMISKTEQLDATKHLKHVLLSGTVNGTAANVIGKPENGQFLLNISANGRSSTNRLPLHAEAVFLPDFDPGALETLLALAAIQNGRDLWAILPKQAGSAEPVQVATYPDEQGTLNQKPITVHHVVATIAGAQTDLFAGPENQLMQAELPQQGFALVRNGFVLTPPKKPSAPLE
ncbi:hypothetical protein DYQ86_13460 [Acidobacteria bacterium AB60]|nr:hypothetical protein DYQ86_13460 [Acidobacteria bacterium AB60]